VSNITLPHTSRQEKAPDFSNGGRYRGALCPAGVGRLVPRVGRGSWRKGFYPPRDRSEGAIHTCFRHFLASTIRVEMNTFTFASKVVQTESPPSPNLRQEALAISQKWQAKWH
jgi:hypothetical protein